MNNLLEGVEENLVKTPLNQGEDYNLVFFDLFNLFVGKEGKRFTPSEVSAASGISIKTIENYCQRISAPSFPNLVTLCKILPFEFKSRFINLLGGNDIVQDIRKDYAGILEELASKVRKGAI